jgi:RNA polymerase sigma-70 factor (ECF subfamily)
MLTVFQHREVFQHDRSRGRFRAWLGTVVRNAVAERRRQPQDRIRGHGGDGQDAILVAEAGEPQPDAEWEAAFDKAMLVALLDIVRREVAPRTYQAFELAALHDLPGRRVAEITGLRLGAVYAARLRVLRRLRELGAQYRKNGQLTEQLKQALAGWPDPAVERAMIARLTVINR